MRSCMSCGIAETLHFNDVSALMKPSNSLQLPLYFMASLELSLKPKAERLMLMILQRLRASARESHGGASVGNNESARHID